MIRKGEPWGAPAELTGAEPVAHDDASLARLLAAAHLAGEPAPVVIVTGGDLRTALGGRPSEQPHRLPVDLLEVDVAGVVVHGVAHVVFRAPMWHGRFFVGMNGSHLGRWNLGPKAHPNDGLVDITEGSLSPGDRLAARRRAPTGAHLPHPELSVSRVRRAVWQSERPMAVRVDGVAMGRATEVTVTVIPDVGSVIVG